MMDENIGLEPTHETTADAAPGLATDRRFKLLKNRRRRAVIRYLAEHRDPTTRSELAEVIAAGEEGIDVSELDSSQRKRVYVSLYQTHLPALERDDVIEYDGDRGTVAPGPNLPELARYIRPLPDPDGAAGSPRYLWLGLLGGATYVAIRVFGGAIPVLTDVWALGFVLSVLLVWANRRRE
jgi:DNA-binding transcriptional ArsR family regulator